MKANERELFSGKKTYSFSMMAMNREAKQKIAHEKRNNIRFRNYLIYKWTDI